MYSHTYSLAIIIASVLLFHTGSGHAATAIGPSSINSSAITSSEISPSSIHIRSSHSDHALHTPHPILTGADRLDLYLPLLKGRSIAIYANQTSTIGNRHLVDSLVRLGVHIQKIFSPEHGFRGDAPDGSHIGNTTDPGTGIPIVSLYGSKNKPTAADLADVDIMLFDIQDVGARFYTYISSLQKYIESAIANDKPLIILDRPNPNGSYIDGPILDKKFRSFVGMQPVPVVYGMTMGEYAHMLISEQWLDNEVAVRTKDVHTITKQLTHLDSMVHAAHTPLLNLGAGHFRLIVIPCGNYTHASSYSLPVQPSPNLPNMQSVYLYPSICFFEGTAVSLGRGTAKAFQQFGHPSFPKDLYRFTPHSTPGSTKPPLKDETCYGYDLSGVDVQKETGGRITLKWLILAYKLFPQKDSFFLATNYIDKLAGTNVLQQQIRKGLSEDAIRKSWEPGLTAFRAIRKKYLLYK